MLTLIVEDFVMSGDEPIAEAVLRRIVERESPSNPVAWIRCLIASDTAVQEAFGVKASGVRN